MNETKEEADIKEFLEYGYTMEEIEKMSNEKSVYSVVALINGKIKEEIDKELGKR